MEGKKAQRREQSKERATCNTGRSTDNKGKNEPLAVLRCFPSL